MPVLPLVGSTIVAPGCRRPSRSAAATIATAMRSLTLPAGLSDSSLPSTAALRGPGNRFSRTSGVLPTRSSTESATHVVRTAAAPPVSFTSTVRFMRQQPRRPSSRYFLFPVPCSLFPVPCSLNVVSPAHRLALACGQVRDRGAVQDLARRVVDLLPHLALGTAALPGAGAALIQARAGNQRPLECLDHFVDRHLRRLTHQLVAALRPADAADETRATQRRQQMVEVWFGNALAGGDLGALQRPLAVVQRQLDQRPHAVVALRRNLHAACLSPPPLKWTNFINIIGHVPEQHKRRAILST